MPKNLLHTLTTDKKIPITVPSGLTEEGRTVLSQHLYALTYHALPDDFDTTWLITRGKYAGTLPKRIASLFRAEYGAKLSPAELGAIGSIAREHTEIEPTPYLFDITRSLNWQDGDFGDDGSCYWHNSRQALDILMDNDCAAIRFYDPHNSRQGIARAWLAPLTLDPAYKTAHDTLILWNGYQVRGSCLTAITQTRILALYLGLTYNRTRLQVNDDDCEVIYINGGYGYTIGPTIPDGVNLSMLTEAENTCELCDRTMNEDDTYTLNDRDFCPNCYHNLPYCEACDDPTTEECNTTEDGYTLCEYHYENQTHQCEVCLLTYHRVGNLDTHQEEEHPEELEDEETETVCQPE